MQRGKCEEKVGLKRCSWKRTGYIMYREKNKEAKRAVAMAGNQAYDQLY